MSLHSESPRTSNRYRADLFEEIKVLIKVEQGKADRRRKRFFRPDFTSVQSYSESLLEYRRKFVDMLGWPLNTGEIRDVPGARQEWVAGDDLGRCYRLWIDTLPGSHAYGLFFLPPGRGPFPLVISQHGGMGTPELCSGFFGPSNYNDMTRRVLRRGCAVFAPQLLLWNPEIFGPNYDKDHIDRQLKQLGGSLAALEIFRIRRCLDWLSHCDEIDASRIGMIGLSYGGFYTMFTAAADLRVRVAVSSCFFSNRKIYDFPDWTWFNSLNMFQDVEVAGLICPRPLYIEVGKRDELFAVRYAGPEARKVATSYEKLGIPDRFRYREHDGGHELDMADGGIDFLCQNLLGSPT